jgi:hypothetical protein
LATIFRSLDLLGLSRAMTPDLRSWVSLHLKNSSNGGLFRCSKSKMWVLELGRKPDCSMTLAILCIAAGWSSLCSNFLRSFVRQRRYRWPKRPVRWMALLRVLAKNPLKPGLLLILSRPWWSRAFSSDALRL